MKKFVDAEVMQHSFKLQQMGAKVNVINSKLCYIRFDVSGFKIEYVYNVNTKGKYFLERIKPYPLAMKEFDREEDVIQIIEIDLSQFKSAIKSHNINSFIDISRKLNKTLKKFEDLFLYYNVPTEEVDSLMSNLNQFDSNIEEIKSKSKRLFFEKDPDNL